MNYLKLINIYFEIRLENYYYFSREFFSYTNLKQNKIQMKTLYKLFFVLLLLSLILLISLAYFVQQALNTSNKAIYADKNDQKKYVVYECTNEGLCGGWADRLKVFHLVV